MSKDQAELTLAQRLRIRALALRSLKPTKLRLADAALDEAAANALDARPETDWLAPVPAQAVAAPVTDAMVAHLTRPIGGILTRNPHEVFDIMCDRIRAALSTTPQENT